MSRQFRARPGRLLAILMATVAFAAVTVQATCAFAADTQCATRRGCHRAAARAARLVAGRRGGLHEPVSRQHRRDQELRLVDQVHARQPHHRAVQRVPHEVPSPAVGHITPDDEGLLRLPRPAPRLDGHHRQGRVRGLPRHAALADELPARPRTRPTGPARATSSSAKTSSTPSACAATRSPTAPTCHDQKGIVWTPKTGWDYDSASGCQSCHGSSNLLKQDNGIAKSFQVSGVEESAHRDITCQQCHTDYRYDDKPLGDPAVERQRRHRVRRRATRTPRRRRTATPVAALQQVDPRREDPRGRLQVGDLRLVPRRPLHLPPRHRTRPRTACTARRFACARGATSTSTPPTTTTITVAPTSRARPTLPRAGSATSRTTSCPRPTPPPASRPRTLARPAVSRAVTRARTSSSAPMLASLIHRKDRGAEGQPDRRLLHEPLQRGRAAKLEEHDNGVTSTAHTRRALHLGGGRGSSRGRPPSCARHRARRPLPEIPVTPTIDTAAPVDQSQCAPCHLDLGSVNQPGLIFSHGNHLMVSCDGCHSQHAAQERRHRVGAHGGLLRLPRRPARAPGRAGDLRVRASATRSPSTYAPSHTSKD